jgi:hypothetical protein
MFSDRIIADVEVGFPSEADPPEMGQAFDVVRPVFDGIKGMPENRIFCDFLVEMIHDPEKIVP